MSLPLVRRADFNNSLIHFTRDRSFLGDDGELGSVTAYDALRSILASGSIQASDALVKGTRPVVCLSEVPLSSAHHFEERYSTYGIAMSKSAAFGIGARPVIYLPDNEGSWIPESEKWRQVRFEIGRCDFTWEREWRILGDVELKRLRGIYILVDTSTEADAIRKMASPAQKSIRGIFVMEHLHQML